MEKGIIINKALHYFAPNIQLRDFLIEMSDLLFDLSIFLIHYHCTS